MIYIYILNKQTLKNENEKLANIKRNRFELNNQQYESV